MQLFEGVEPDPSVETVMKGAEAMREFEPDWIVAMGGGSPIDAAKAMWAFYEYPETTFEDLITPFSFPELETESKILLRFHLLPVQRQKLRHSLLLRIMQKASNILWQTLILHRMSQLLILNWLETTAG